MHLYALPPILLLLLLLLNLNTITAAPIPEDRSLPDQLMNDALGGAAFNSVFVPVNFFSNLGLNTAMAKYEARKGRAEQDAESIRIKMQLIEKHRHAAEHQEPTAEGIKRIDDDGGSESADLVEKRMDEKVLEVVKKHDEAKMVEEKTHRGVWMRKLLGKEAAEVRDRRGGRTSGAAVGVHRTNAAAASKGKAGTATGGVASKAK